jgi:hypothetical protein
MRISKRMREQAARICAISASWGKGNHWYWIIAKEIGASKAAVSLAADALVAAQVDDEAPTGRLWSRRDDAEAESLLRTGWSPK